MCGVKTANCQGIWQHLGSTDVSTDILRNLQGTGRATNFFSRNSTSLTFYLGWNWSGAVAAFRFQDMTFKDNLMYLQTGIVRASGIFKGKRAIVTL